MLYAEGKPQKQHFRKEVIREIIKKNVAFSHRRRQALTYENFGHRGSGSITFGFMLACAAAIFPSRALGYFRVWLMATMLPVSGMGCMLSPTIFYAGLIFKVSAPTLVYHGVAFDVKEETGKIFKLGMYKR